jgi:CDP-diacylglycerol--serine O-phosphatidyltransferase
MTEPSDKTSNHVFVVQLIPNMLTVAAIFAGLSAIRYGVQGNPVFAVQLILIAAILDGLDGRLARKRGSDSKIGAELDSLGDFLNFGVAPPLIVYFWALYDLRGLGWMSVLVFAVCCVMRLARFNVASREEAEGDMHGPSAYFTGVPSPAGAILMMWPMFLSFAYARTPIVPDLLICANMILVGLAMISRIPVWSFKTSRVSRENVKVVLVGFAFLGAALLTYPWVAMTGLCIAYVGIVGWCAVFARAHNGKDNA